MSEQRKRIVIVGGAGIDFSMRGPALPSASQPMTGDAFLRDVGGKGANQAVTVARLGGYSALIACIGADPEGDEVLKALAKDDVNTEQVVRDRTEPTACTVICVDGHGRKLTASRPGANTALTIEKIPRHCIAGADVLLMQLEIPSETALAVARLARDSGARVVLDASPVTDVPDDLLRLAEIVSVNASEAEALSRLQVRDRDTAVAAAHAVCRRGARAVSIGLSDGRVLVADAAAHWLPNHPVKVIDTTGAGDACAGAIAVALAEQRSAIEACHFGHAAAAIATTRFGARRSLPDREHLEFFLRMQARH